jgi:uncharacterized protein YjbI with pentapeptide repeats
MQKIFLSNISKKYIIKRKCFIYCFINFLLIIFSTAALGQNLEMCWFDQTSKHPCLNKNITTLNFESSNLENSNFSGIKLKNFNFKNSNLKNSNFENSDLRGANFSGANLENANFSKTNLSGAIFDKNSILKNVNWSNSICPNGEISQNNCSSKINLYNSVLPEKEKSIYQENYIYLIKKSFVVIDNIIYYNKLQDALKKWKDTYKKLSHNPMTCEELSKWVYLSQEILYNSNYIPQKIYSQNEIIDNLNFFQNLDPQNKKNFCKIFFNSAKEKNLTRKNQEPLGFTVFFLYVEFLPEIEKAKNKQNCQLLVKKCNEIIKDFTRLEILTLKKGISNLNNQEILIYLNTKTKYETCINYDSQIYNMIQLLGADNNDVHFLCKFALTLINEIKIQ